MKCKFSSSSMTFREFIRFDEPKHQVGVHAGAIADTIGHGIGGGISRAQEKYGGGHTAKEKERLFHGLTDYEKFHKPQLGEFDTEEQALAQKLASDTSEHDVFYPTPNGTGYVIATTVLSKGSQSSHNILFKKVMDLARDAHNRSGGRDINIGRINPNLMKAKPFGRGVDENGNNTTTYAVKIVMN